LVNSMSRIGTLFPMCVPALQQMTLMPASDDSVMARPEACDEA
jgi:hypothetical protein